MLSGAYAARGLLSIGYDGSADLLQADTVATLADDLYEEMARKSVPRSSPTTKGQLIQVAGCVCFCK